MTSNDSDKDVEVFMKGGSGLHMLRNVRSDGLRVMGVLAKFCAPGEDPVKVLVRALASQGCDVGSLLEWAEE